MKIALYIQDGLEQIVLTPEGKVETDILAKLHDGSRDLSIERGSFFECRGGWVRQGPSDSSTMIVLRTPKAIEARSDETEGLGPKGESAVPQAFGEPSTSRIS